MKSVGALLVASAALAAATPQNVARASSKTPTVSVKGNAFFTSDGNRFYVRGVDYQPGGSSNASDPIADSAGCKRDIAKFTELGINTVRVYTVDNSANHDECMQALAAAGIYLALDVNTPKYSINRANPSKSYNDVYLQSVFATIDSFANYPNTLLFFSGNEVINDNTTTNCAPYVKAVTRDMKQYISSRKYRQIPVGYSAADVDTNRYEMATYMNCGSDDERSDFFAFNDYSWCDPSSFTQSGWDQKVKQYGNYSIPLFLSEFGCNKNTRQFNEIASLYSSQMTSVYSGGLVYEYSQEASKFGLVTINEDDSVTELPDFKTLKSKLAQTPAPSGDGDYKANGSPSTCPAQSATWDVDGDGLPSIPEPAKKYMTSGAGKGPGLNGPGSQDSGVQSTSTAAAGKSTSTHNAAPGTYRAPEWSFAPFICTGVVFFSTMFGAYLL